MQYLINRADNRGKKDIGWLVSNFSFSFSSYQNPANNGFGLLSTLNDDVVKPGNGFGLHPHTNMEIISVMLKGRMNHKDSMGYSDVVEKDWVQIMSAGSGLKHEEYNVGDEDVNFLQIWIQPKLQNITPRYQRRHFPLGQRQNQLKTIVSNEEGVEHCWINQNAKLSLGAFDSGKNISYPIHPTNKCVYVFVIEGSIRVAGETLQRRDAIGIWESDVVSIETTESSQFLIIEVPVNH